MSAATHAVGVDFGGTGIKGAPVDLLQGGFSGPRERVATPQPATPSAIARVLTQMLAAIPEATVPVGITVPAVVRKGIVESAANIDASWVGMDADALFTDALHRDVHVVNDADAAGLAEARFGAAAGQGGLVIVTTLGTGIGSALIYNGVLIPNSELGHLEIDGCDAETRAANSARVNEDLSYRSWARRLTTYYATVERLFSPDLIVVGGGVSKSADKFLPYVEIKTRLVPAQLRNTAGIIGAALYAVENR